jgi:hypothetical protein
MDGVLDLPHLAHQPKQWGGDGLLGKSTRNTFMIIRGRAIKWSLLTLAMSAEWSFKMK